MNINDYQDQAGKTAIFKEEDALLYTILSLSAEAGEIASKYSKIIRDNNGVITPSDKLETGRKKLGDCRWNSAVCARELGYSLRDYLPSDELSKIKQPFRTWGSRRFGR